MSTRAQIAIQTSPEEWAHVYVHYDGYPAHMLAALSGWTPEDILAAREIRQVRADKLDCFEPPRAPRWPPRRASARARGFGAMACAPRWCRPT